MAVKIPIPTIAALSPEASTRERILTASVELLLIDGFSALTQQAVAARAGVRQSHLTYYFPTRNDLLRATAQFGVEKMMAPIAEVAGHGPVTLAEFRQLLMPDKSDRQWFKLMTGLSIASEEDESIGRWLCEFDERVDGMLAAAFKSAGLPATREQLQFLHATFIGALTLDMQQQKGDADASFERVERTVAMALDAVLPQLAAARASDAAPAATTTGDATVGGSPAQAPIAVPAPEIKPHIKPRKAAP